MSYQFTVMKKAALYAFSVLTMVFAANTVTPASAASVELAIHHTSASGHTVEAKLLNVHHRKRRHRRFRRGPRFQLYIGTPYYPYSYGYYPRSHYRYCRKIRRRCAYRHGWRNYRWRRCVRYYGCR